MWSAVKEHTFTDPIYRPEIVCLYGDDFSQWQKKGEFERQVTEELQKKQATSSGQITTWQSQTCHRTIDVVWIAEGDDLTSTIWHESLHAACRILRRKGIFLEPESEEAFTYYQGHIAETITEFIADCKKKRRTRRRKRA